MPPRPSTLIALTIATLYTLAGQAHFTSRLTPGLAENIDIMTPNAHAVYGEPLGLDYPTTKYVFGAFDLFAAALLWRRRTRTAGLTAAVIGFAGGLHGQVHAGGELGQVGAMFAMAIMGRMLAACGW